MRIRVAGAGPSGLLFSLLARRRRPDADIRVVEQNPRGATFGFGVVFSHGALEFLARDLPGLHATLMREMESWPVQRIVHRDQSIDIDGNGFCAIGRLRLIELLAAQCVAEGVAIDWDHPIRSVSDLGPADLIVAADGLNSALRREHAAHFGPQIDWLRNKFAWYGTSRVFDCLTLTFRDTEHGPFVAHHYRYAPDRSTFIVECDAATWHRAGLHQMDDAASRAFCEHVFAADLQGHPLQSNRSIWRNFPLLRNRHWSAGNVVLIGDALRTGHFSIGSGTRLAFDDAIALDRALDEAGNGGDDVARVLAAYERERRPVVDKLVAAANQSSYWYERIADVMAMSPVELAYDYMTRSGRIDDARLADMAPRFMAQVEAERRADVASSSRRSGRVVDPAPVDSAGSREIGFEIPERYNAASMLFGNLAAGRGDKLAVIGGDRQLTYAQLAAGATRAADGFARFGLKRGGRVLLLLDDHPEHVMAIFGAMHAGFVPVLVNTLSPQELVAWMLQDTGAEAMVLDAAFASVLQHPELASARLRHVVVVGEATHVEVPELVALHRWDEWLEVGGTDRPMADTHRDEMAFWMYSSGSTGRPKGVVHLHHDAPYTFASYGRQVLQLRESDLVFSPPKIFFAYGFGNSITFPFLSGATTLLLEGRPEPQRVLDAIEQHRPTVLFGLPTLYNALINHPDSEARDLSSLRLCLSAAEVLSESIFQTWQQRYGLEIVEGLGSTEVLHIYLSNQPGRTRSGASGLRVPGYDVKLVDADGHEVPAGEPGILCVRGTSQAPMYWRRPDKTAETMRDGWIWTGDRFHVDADGYHFFDGRADDLVKVSGQWVHPLEVERCLAEHPQVRECAVVVGEDPQRLKLLVAHVVLDAALSPGDAATAELQRFVKQRLAPYKYPRVVRYAHALPKTGTGKIDRQALLKAG